MGTVRLHSREFGDMYSLSSDSEVAVCRTRVKPGPRAGPSWLMAYPHVTAGLGWAGPIPRVLPLGALDTPFCGNGIKPMAG